VLQKDLGGFLVQSPVRDAWRISRVSDRHEHPPCRMLHAGRLHFKVAVSLTGGAPTRPEAQEGSLAPRRCAVQNHVEDEGALIAPLTGVNLASQLDAVDHAPDGLMPSEALDFVENGRHAFEPILQLGFLTAGAVPLLGRHI